MKFVLALAAVAVLAFAPQARAQDTVAKQMIMLDAKTGTVLIEKNADELMHPASMSKLMTLWMVFQRLRDGQVKLTDTFPVSERAWRMGGSKMFVQVNSLVKLEDLLRGIIVQSGNDACVVVAEGLAGSEQKFAEQMTQEARRIGLKQSVLKNATGWPEPQHLMTAREIALLSRHIIEEFPQFYSFFSEKEFAYNGIKQGNRNPLVYGKIVADGLKTGHTEESGYGLAASMKQGDQRLILVVNGLSSMAERARESARLMEMGFREFQTYALFKKGDAVENAEVWLGSAKSVPLIADRDIAVTINKRMRGELKATVKYQGPIPAPVAKGTQVATLLITAPGKAPVEVPLVAAEDVDKLGVVARIGAAMRHVFMGPQT